jgi:hypothetical protein
VHVAPALVRAIWRRTDEAGATFRAFEPAPAPQNVNLVSVRDLYGEMLPNIILIARVARLRQCAAQLGSRGAPEPVING